MSIDPMTVVTSVVVLLFSLSLHESAHAWTADRLGDPTARRLGRVTLNPLVHMDLLGTVLFPLAGLLSGGVLFGWAKPVPVDTSHLERPRRDHLLIAAAGPASNVALSVAFLVGLKIFDHAPWHLPALIEPLAMVCRAGLFLNVILAVFNLIPIPPLDGSWILSGLLPPRGARLLEGIRPYGFALLLVLLFSGSFDIILEPVLGLVRGLMY